MSLDNSESSNGSPSIVPVKNEKNEIPEFISRKRAGWADEGNKSAKSNNSLNLMEQKRFLNERIDSDDDIPIIPDIDDLPNDFASSGDMKIPNVSVKRATYKEIDKENKLKSLKMNDANFGNIVDIDLTLLTNRLYSEADVKNADEEWTLNSFALDLANCLENT